MAKHRRKLVRLLLCCNRNPKPGFINVDIEAFPGVDVVTDLNETWPWKDSSVDEIVAIDALEHLKCPTHVFNEAWRVLKPGGILHHLTPSTDGRGAWQDPTHISFFNANSWSYYEVALKTGKYISHPWRQLYAPHIIQAAFVVEAKTHPMDAAGIIYEEVWMVAVKDPIYVADESKLERAPESSQPT